MVAEKGKAKAPRPEIGEGSLRVARLTKPHGLKGGLKVELYTDNPDLRFVPEAKFHLQVLEDSEWFNKTITLAELRWYNDQPVAFFNEIADRTAAESIVKAILWIDETKVLEGKEENAWYDQELAGMKVFKDGTEIGSVIEVQHLPGHDLLLIEAGGVKSLIPFVKEIVPEVDGVKRQITITPPEGLLEQE